jgi:hypothetical protein
LGDLQLLVAYGKLGFLQFMLGSEQCVGFLTGLAVSGKDGFIARELPVNFCDGGFGMIYLDIDLLESVQVESLVHVVIIEVEREQRKEKPASLIFCKIVVNWPGRQTGCRGILSQVYSFLNTLWKNKPGLLC